MSIPSSDFSNSKDCGMSVTAPMEDEKSGRKAVAEMTSSIEFFLRADQFKGSFFDSLGWGILPRLQYCFIA